MTKKQIQQAVKLWQSRLRLQHWDISVDWSTRTTENNYATTTRMNSYDTASIRFDAACGSWTDDFTHKTIVHELMHLHLRDLDRVLGDAHGLIPADTFTHLERRYDHEAEGIVDRLATILVELA